MATRQTAETDRIDRALGVGNPVGFRPSRPIVPDVGFAERSTPGEAPDPGFKKRRPGLPTGAQRRVIRVTGRKVRR